MRVQVEGVAWTSGGTKGTVRSPSNRPPRKIRVFVEGSEKPWECSKAVRGRGGKPPMLGREMRWRTPGWMSGLVILDVLGEVVGEGGAEMLGDLPGKVTAQSP